jgi:hypothetical protein
MKAKTFYVEYPVQTWRYGKKEEEEEERQSAP